MWRNSASASGCVPGSGTLLKRWRRDNDGATAVEFAMVGIPFLSLLFGIMGIGMFYFTTFSLENALEQASRAIRTGQAQQTNMTAAQFKAQVCSRAPAFVDCSGKLKVNVQSFPSSAAINPATIPSCLGGPGGGLNQSSSYVPGQENVVVLAWLCYEWSMAKNIPFINLSNMGNGSRLIQATTTFRTEPYK